MPTTPTETTSPSLGTARLSHGQAPIDDQSAEQADSRAISRGSGIQGRPVAVPRAAIGAFAIAATALAATAIGALSVAALSIWQLSIYKARLKSLKIETLEIDELNIHRLTGAEA